MQSPRERTLDELIDEAANKRSRDVVLEDIEKLLNRKLKSAKMWAEIYEE